MRRRRRRRVPRVGVERRGGSGGVGAGASVESVETFAVQVDTSYEFTRSVPLVWLLDFDVAGEHLQLRTPVILDVPELD